ncbi:MAG: MBL fold metallo-hydrolase [Pseudomonadota bacterium]
MTTVNIEAFFDPNTFSYSYVVWDVASREGALIDTVYDYDPVAGKLSSAGADQMLAFVRQHNIEVTWILETHVHADHLSAAVYLKGQCGGQICIGARVTEVQRQFGQIFNFGAELARDGSQFDRLLRHGEHLALGESSIEVIATPGHTPACVSYKIGDAVFVGDTLFMPDYGTARADFPGADARVLYESIQKLLSLPESTRLFMCHDYGSESRTDFVHQTTVGEQQRCNIHIAGKSSEEFVGYRKGRDAKLAAPRLLYPAVQFNMRAGHMPEAEANGQAYFKMPVRVA